MIVNLTIELEINADENIELSEIMRDIEYNVGSSIADVISLADSYELIDSK